MIIANPIDPAHSHVADFDPESREDQECSHTDPRPQYDAKLLRRLLRKKPYSVISLGARLHALPVVSFYPHFCNQILESEKEPQSKIASR